jgi:hypothetical protein
MNIQEFTQKLREDDGDDIQKQDDEKLARLFKLVQAKIDSGALDIGDVEDAIHDMFGVELEEMSVSGGAGAYNPGLDVPKKKYQGPEYRKESKDKEPKLAAGKIKKDYAVTHFGFKEAPSIPNRPSKGGFEYKNLWEEGLNESYSRFKKDTSTRNKTQQYHEGVKLVRKELGKINTLMEYLKKLKENLNEDGSLEESRHTKKALNQILEKIKSVYVKAKTL